MDSTSENQYFLLIKKHKITFAAFNNNNEIILTKEIFFENYHTDNLIELLESFLEKYVFEIEKSLQVFLKELNIIFESDNFFSAGSAIKNNLKGTNFYHNQINDMLIDIRDQFKKYSLRNEIVHMVIQNIIIDGNEYKVLPKIDSIENLVIQVNFICLNDQIIQNLKRILSKYQISLSRILSYNYLNDLKKYPGESIFKVANNNLNGLHKNEVLIAKKSLKYQGFFEKFFKFFT